MAAIQYLVPLVAEFEAKLGHLRTGEGMAKARAKGRLKGKQPKLPLAAPKTIHRRYRDPGDDANLADLAGRRQRRPLHHPPHHQQHHPAPDLTLAPVATNLATTRRRTGHRQPDVTAGQANFVIFRATTTGTRVPKRSGFSPLPTGRYRAALQHAGERDAQLRMGRHLGDVDLVAQTGSVEMVGGSGENPVRRSERQVGSILFCGRRRDAWRNPAQR